jgi:hypothetical protein
MKTLTKEHSYVSLNQGAPNVWSVAAGSNWRLVSPTTFVSDMFFDLAGMSQREKTLFFEGATCQEFLNPSHTGGAAGDAMAVFDIMTSQPITDNGLLQWAAFGNFATGASGVGYQETIYGRVRQYTIDLDTAAWGSFILVSDNQIGSLEATASDRIYCYRLVVIDAIGVSATDIVVNSARYLLRAEAKEEAEFQYLMRLRRSYELQQSHDED